MLRKGVGVAGLLLLAAACQHVTRVQPTQFIPAKNPETVWVQIQHGAFLELQNPQIAGDTLKGKWRSTMEDVALPLNDIESVRAKQPDTKRTAILSVAGAAILGVTGYWIANQGNGKFSNCGATKGTPNNYCCNVAAGEKPTSDSC